MLLNSRRRYLNLWLSKSWQKIVSWPQRRGFESDRVTARRMDKCEGKKLNQSYNYKSWKRGANLFVEKSLIFLWKAGKDSQTTIINKNAFNVYKIKVLS